MDYKQIIILIFIPICLGGLINNIVMLVSSKNEVGAIILQPGIISNKKKDISYLQAEILHSSVCEYCGRIVENCMNCKGCGAPCK